MSEIHTHCQCDFCTGEDCGQDDPEKLKAEQEAQQKEHDEQVRKEERERVLTALWKEMFRDTSMRFINDTYRMHNEWYEAIESLRKGAL